jgi:hypothetical protein
MYQQCESITSSAASATEAGHLSAVAWLALLLLDIGAQLIACGADQLHRELPPARIGDRQILILSTQIRLGCLAAQLPPSALAAAPHPSMSQNRGGLLADVLAQLGHAIVTTGAVCATVLGDGARQRQAALGLDKLSAMWVLMRYRGGADGIA